MARKPKPNVQIVRGRYGLNGDIVDACEYMARNYCGLASVALARMVRESPLFQRTIREMKRERKEQS